MQCPPADGGSQPAKCHGSSGGLAQLDPVRVSAPLPPTQPRPTPPRSSSDRPSPPPPSPFVPVPLTLMGHILASASISVDLPHPEGPVISSRSPASRARLSPETTAPPSQPRSTLIPCRRTRGSLPLGKNPISLAVCRKPLAGLTAPSSRGPSAASSAAYPGRRRQSSEGVWGTRS